MREREWVALPLRRFSGVGDLAVESAAAGQLDFGCGHIAVQGGGFLDLYQLGSGNIAV